MISSNIRLIYLCGYLVIYIWWGLCDMYNMLGLCCYASQLTTGYWWQFTHTSWEFITRFFVTKKHSYYFHGNEYDFLLSKNAMTAPWSMSVIGQLICNGRLWFETLDPNMYKWNFPSHELSKQPYSPVCYIWAQYTKTKGHHTPNKRPALVVMVGLIEAAGYILSCSDGHCVMKSLWVVSDRRMVALGKAGGPI